MPDLRIKQQQMAASLFPFFRAILYRWAQVWPEGSVPGTGARAASLVGGRSARRELRHLARLRWPAGLGGNDFDEACSFPYTMDLVRLAASALLASREERLTMKPKDAAAAILAGNEYGMEEGGRPFVLVEDHAWLRARADATEKDWRAWQERWQS